MKLLEIIEEYKVESGVSNNAHLKISTMALSGLREFQSQGLNTTAIKTISIPVSSLGTVPIPDDYINYTKVGINYSGRLWTLTVNRDMLPPSRKVECGMTVEEAQNISSANQIEDAWAFLPHYSNSGSYVSKKFGLGGGWNSQGYFKEDLTNRRFLLDTPAGEIVLEYISDEVGLDAIVPQYAVEGIKSWIDYKMAMYDKSIGAYMKSELGSALDSQMKKIIQLKTPFRVDEYLDSFYTDVYQGLKR
jgi:hypothetical protein